MLRVHKERPQGLLSHSSCCKSANDPLLSSGPFHAANASVIIRRSNNWDGMKSLNVETFRGYVLQCCGDN